MTNKDLVPITSEDRIHMFDRKTENRLGMFCHLLSFAGLLFPLGHILGPLILWLMKKDDSPAVAYHGKEAVNFQISVTIYMLISIILMFIFIGIPLFFILLLMQFILIIVATINAADGKLFRYPLTLRFIK
jgi:uncharacterized Tic20 family protein